MQITDQDRNMNRNRTIIRPATFSVTVCTCINYVYPRNQLNKNLCSNDFKLVINIIISIKS